MDKMHYKIFFLFFFIFFSYSFVFGLGVSPARTEIDFVPNLETSFEMGVINNPLIDREVEIYVNLFELDENVRDEFRDVVSLGKTRMSFTKNEAKKTLTVFINLPEGFSQAGIHKLRIGARPPLSSDGEGLAVVAGNEIDVLINVAEEYVDGKYAVVKELKILDVRADSVNQGEETNIEVFIKSESEVVLSDVYASIKILIDGREIRTIKTKEIGIAPGEEKTFSEVFNTDNIQSGNFVLDVEVFYGSDSVKSIGSFSVYSEGKGISIGKSDFKFPWMWLFIIVVIVILLLILLFLFLLLRKKKNEDEVIDVRKESITNN